MITLAQVKALRVGDILYHTQYRNADGTPKRWRVNGQVKTWKTKPGVIRIPVKHGLRDFGYVTQDDLHLVSLDEEAALRGE